jgi:hypothetical protein
MDNIFNHIINSGIVVLVFILIYSIYLYLKSVIRQNKYLSSEQLELLENVCRYAVGFAEQMYKTDKTVDRYQIAIEYVYDIVNKAGFDYCKLMNIVNGLIESQVLKLPQTHKVD